MIETLALTRHGATWANLAQDGDGAHHGLTPDELRNVGMAPVGYHQGKLAGLAHNANGFSYDAVITSGLGRTQDTATEMMHVLGPIACHADDRLNEREFGEFDPYTMSQLFMWIRRMNYLDFRPDPHRSQTLREMRDGSTTEFLNDLHTFIPNDVRAQEVGASILLVTHSERISTLIAKILGFTNSEWQIFMREPDNWLVNGESILFQARDEPGLWQARLRPTEEPYTLQPKDWTKVIDETPELFLPSNT